MATAHEFEVHTFFGPSHCDQCGGFMWGLRKQGFQCQYCERKICKSCIKNTQYTTAVCPVLEQQQRDLAAQATKLEKQPSNIGMQDGVELAEVYDWYRKYVKRNAKGDVEVTGLPNEWKELFREAGIKPVDLKDPSIAIELIKAMKVFLKKVEVNVVQEGAAFLPVLCQMVALYAYEAQSETDISFYKGDIIDVVRMSDEDGQWYVGRPVGVGYPPRTCLAGHWMSEIGFFPANYAVAISAPSGPPPAIPDCEPVAIDVSSPSTADLASSYTPSLDASAASLANSAMSVDSPIHSEPTTPVVVVEHAQQAEQQGEPEKPSAGQQEQQQQQEQQHQQEQQQEQQQAQGQAPVQQTGAPMPPPPPMPTKRTAVISDLKKSAPKTPGPQRKANIGGLLAEIQNSSVEGLKPVQKGEADVKDLNDDQRSDLLSIMKRVMHDRRGSLMESAGGDDDDEDEWSD